MAKEEAVEAMARVLETWPEAMVRVELEGCDHRVLAHISGKSATFYSHSSRDKVLVDLSPYDLNRGRITYRYK